jgi:hypothetical protein
MRLSSKPLQYFTVLPAMCFSHPRAVNAVKRSLLLVILVFALGGCGLARQREMQSERAAKAQSDAAAQECQSKFPQIISATVVAHAKCLNEAAAIARPAWSYPDLLDSFLATRMALAERVQKGQITIAQGTEELANKKSEIVAEEQRRNLANRSVTAQEVTAQNIGGPSTCVRNGNTVNCF